MTAEQLTQARPLNGKFVAEIATIDTVAEVAILDRETSKKRVAGAFTFLRTGDVFFDFSANPNGREPTITYPDADGNPDEGMAALLYAGATLKHPFTEDGAVGNIKVMAGESTSDKVRDNLGAIGIDFGADLPKINLDHEDHSRWADDLPSIPAEKVVLDFGEHFELVLPTKTPATI